MALPATLHRVNLTLSDVDRGVYEQLELRLARHPSESARYLLTRLLAYALSYEPGSAFSKGGLSDADEPPVSIWDMTGARLAWVDVGGPSAERLHKASKATPRVLLYTHLTLEQLSRQLGDLTAIHRAETICVWHLDPQLLSTLEPHLSRSFDLELVRSDGRLYITVNGQVIESALEQHTLG
ncbi:MAG: YaeQ family protein [Polyangiaceae bacterium]|nr:YaeQ family protein [Polyangiaceae bacterium]MCW5790220.1 YaeQ family protein [Polyangiaceae bacterium]